jgi:hypothetical protein
MTKIARDRDIVARYHAGESVQMIGSSHRLSRQRIYRILERNRVERHGPSGKLGARRPRVRGKIHESPGDVPQIRRPTTMSDISSAIRLAVRIRDNGYVPTAGEGAMLANALLARHEEHRALEAELAAVQHTRLRGGTHARSV